jgi:phage shock protein PspC (stress-responsive transcriptional regulator)
VYPWIRNIIDKQAFGVCTKIADLLNMKASSVRLFFIYSSFLTLGSPLLVYLIMAFVFRLKDMVNSKKSSVFDL